LPVSLPNLNDARWRDPLSRFPNSSQMDMPSPPPTHEDSTPRPSDSVRDLLLGSPSLRLTPTSTSQVVSSVTIANAGSGLLAWRAKPEQSWLRVNKQAGVALSPDVPCTPGYTCVRSPTLTITVNLAQAPLTGQGSVVVESLTTGQRLRVWVIRDYRSDGTLLKGSGHAVFVMQNGLKRHVPNQQTFEAQGFDRAAILSVSNATLNGLATGQPLLDVLANGNLLRGSTPQVYVMQGGRKRHVTSMSVMTSCGYSRDAVYRISNSQLAAVATGAPLSGPPCPVFSPPAGTLLKGSGQAVYVMSRGIKRHIPNGVTFEATGYKLGNVNSVPNASLASIPNGEPLLNALANGNLLRAAGPAIYVMESGRKRHIASLGAKSSCGYGRDAVRSISDGKLATIATGASLTGPPCPAFSPATGTLLQGSGAEVYVMDGGRKRYITSPSVVEACGYLWGNINPIANSTLNRISTGPNLTGAPCP